MNRKSATFHTWSALLPAVWLGLAAGCSNPSSAGSEDNWTPPPWYHKDSATQQEDVGPVDSAGNPQDSGRALDSDVPSDVPDVTAGTDGEGGDLPVGNELPPVDDTSSVPCTEASPTKCASDKVLVHCVDGEWVATPCGPDESCLDGACKGQVCQPLITTVCLDDDTSGLCNAYGTDFLPQPCLANYTCNETTGKCECKSPLQVLFLLDASGSMLLNLVDGKSRWEHAQDAIATVMAAYPKVQYGLKTFPDEDILCASPGCDSQGGCLGTFTDGLAFSPGAAPTDLLTYLAMRKLAAPGGSLQLVLTPLAAALKNLVDADLGTFKTATQTPRYVILISDGEDTCYAAHAPELLPGVLGSSVIALRDQWQIYTYAIGFGFDSPQLAAVAQTGGTGKAKPLLATDGAELAKQLSDIMDQLDAKSCTGKVAEPKVPDCKAVGAADSDADGWCDDLDCKDSVASVHPGASELEAGIDDDCDGMSDEPDGYIPPPPNPTEGCKGIDFLFVIDNSGSMLNEQEALVASFPGFISAIQAAVPTGDYHIMVVDSDATGYSSGSSTSNCTMAFGVKSCTCAPSPSCCDAICKDVSWGPTTSCNGFPACEMNPPPELKECDNTLGAGRTYSGNYDFCFASPPRYITSAVPNLNGTFACMGKVGVGGDGNEKVMEAMVKAITPPLSGPGGCNEGFLRKEAILVVTFITDESEKGSAGSVSSWTQALVDAKLGQKEGVYVLGVFSDTDLEQPVCKGDEEVSVSLREFVEGFGNQGLACSVCLTSYSQCFAQSVSGIATTCENYVTE